MYAARHATQRTTRLSRTGGSDDSFENVFRLLVAPWLLAHDSRKSNSWPLPHGGHSGGRGGVTGPGGDDLVKQRTPPLCLCMNAWLPPASPTRPAALCLPPARRSAACFACSALRETQLGSSELRVSAMGLGCMTFGERNSYEESSALLGMAGGWLASRPCSSPLSRLLSGRRRDAVRHGGDVPCAAAR